jgi:hypothetical protein
MIDSGRDPLLYELSATALYSGFSTESDWFLEFYNHSLEHIGMSDFQ